MEVVSCGADLDHLAPSAAPGCLRGFLATFTPAPESPAVLFQGPAAWGGLGQLWLPQVAVSGCAWNRAHSSLGQHSLFTWASEWWSL